MTEISITPPSRLFKLNYNAYTAQYLRNTVTQLKKIKEMAGVIYNNL